MGLAAPVVEELLLASRRLGDGRHQIELSVLGIYCGGCIAAI